MYVPKATTQLKEKDSPRIMCNISCYGSRSIPELRSLGLCGFISAPVNISGKLQGSHIRTLVGAIIHTEPCVHA